MENNQEINIIITLVVGVLVMLIMTISIVFFVIKYQANALKQQEILADTERKFQKDLLNASIVASDSEREAVAKNIHDDIGALTNIIKLNNNRLKNNLSNKGLTIELIDKNNGLLLEINENIRSISNNLASATLNKLGFIRALEQLCSQITPSVKTELTIENEDIRFDRKSEIQLFRICKEVLNNILKHTNASIINLNITFVQNFLIISITHNGNGISNEEVRLIMDANNGLGLKSVYSRVQLLEGTLNYVTQKEEKPEILIKLPIKQEMNV